jgi:RNA-binding protein
MISHNAQGLIMYYKTSNMIRFNNSKEVDLMKLTPEQKKYLKSLAHSIQPTVMIGKEGLTSLLLKEVSRTLTSHELIKIKFIQSKSDKATISQDIADECKALVVSVVGNMAILYKQPKKTENRKIKLPNPHRS